MTQTYEKTIEMNSLEVEEIECSKVQTSKENEVDELLGDLNFRYFEEVMSLKDAKDKIHASQRYSNFSFNTYGF